MQPMLVINHSTLAIILALLTPYDTSAWSDMYRPMTVNAQNVWHRCIIKVLPSALEISRILMRYRLLFRFPAPLIVMA